MPNSTTPATPAANPPAPVNANVIEFLDYYCALPTAPHYAVLVKGPWGCGKTHLVKTFFADRPNLKFLYVSLYGVSSVADIESAFFAQLHPLMASRKAKIAAAVGKAALRHLKFDVKVLEDHDAKVEGSIGEISLPKFLTDAGDRILIFDDLERCKMPLKEVMGYINNFVEHDDSKVILLADEDKILEAPNAKEYTDTQEKLIGKAFLVKADLDSAYAGFVAALGDNDLKQFFTLKRGEVETLFRQSQKQNLRTLRQAMLDFERLTSVMDLAHRRKTDALSDMMGPYFAVTFEMKAGSITPSDVTSLGSNSFGGALSEKVAEVTERYPSVDFRNSILGMKVIRDAVFDSALNASAIKALVNKSKYFLAPQDQPVWRGVWTAMDQDDAAAQAASDRLEAAFQARSIIVQGELMHALGQRLWQSRIGALPVTADQVVKDGKAYIDALFAAGKIDPEQMLVDVLGGAEDNYDGYMFMERETEAFQNLALYLRQKNRETLEAQYPAKAQALLKEMETDAGTFGRRLILTNSAENIYAQVPILIYVTPKEFVTRLMAIPPGERRLALAAFSQRYQHLNITPELVKELDWLDEVHGLLQTAFAAMHPIPRFGLIGALNKYVGESLVAARKMAKALEANRQAGVE